GGGEVASGVAHRLHREDFKVCLIEIENPLAVSRGTAFSEAVFDKVKTLMGVTAELVSASLEEINMVWQRGNVPVVIDPDAAIKESLEPDVLVDAIMAKQNTGTMITDAPLVIGLGSGFYAGRDVHIVVETNHGNNLGKVILHGEAEGNTGMPVPIGGLAKERVVWASEAGVFTSDREIGDSVTAGKIIGRVGEQPLEAPISGILRGLMRSGVRVPKYAKLIEVDSVNDQAICNFIADKMRSIGAGVFEAIMLKFDVSARFGGKGCWRFIRH
ncbi:selenium-dependent molybdenum cofactor biosynthesis protein YqeB, partial [Chloroflexota bacterium]